MVIIALKKEIFHYFKVAHRNIFMQLKKISTSLVCIIATQTVKYSVLSVIITINLRIYSSF